MQRAENANPSMLAWARQTAGLSKEQAARSVGLSASPRSTAVDKLVAIESGERQPTRNQLLRFADAYHRPPTVFYLASPPATGRRGEDFRTAPGTPPTALADAVAPFIVVNHQDAIAARSFTLLHELAHVCLGASGVSADPPSKPPKRIHDRIEFFCNDVAGEFLLPGDVISSPRRIGSFDAAQERAEDVAREWRVSQAMVAYRLWRSRRIDRDVYHQLHAFYAHRWQEEKQRQRAQMRDAEGGPSYYVVRRHRLGGALLSLVRHLLQAEELTHTKAAKILGVKPSSVEPLLRDDSNAARPLDF